MSDNIVPDVSSALVALNNGEATTTSRIIAAGTANEHESVMRLLANNQVDFEEFGVLRFEIGEPGAQGGRPAKYALLNEEQATLLVTYLRNTPVVREFKKRLVRAFFELRRRVGVQPAQEQTPAIYDVLRTMVDTMEATQRTADEAKQIAEKADARLDAIEGRHEWYSALGYARLNKISNTSTQFLNKVGRQASSIAKRNNVIPAKVPHQLFGEVNSYPAWVWEIAFAGFEAA